MVKQKQLYQHRRLKVNQQCFFDHTGEVWFSSRQWEIVTYVDVKQLYDKWSLISKQIDTLNKIIEINFKHINGINIHIVLQV